jgi:hypothetical protein
MQTYNIHEAKTHLSRLVEQATRGEPGLSQMFAGQKRLIPNSLRLKNVWTPR